MDKSRRLFVTGTDTGVGKTVVSTILAMGLRRYYWKPIQTGEQTDADFVAQWWDADRVCASEYSFAEPLSPHAAARSAGQTIDLAQILKASNRLPEDLIVEGAGGALVPLNTNEFMVDLMRHLQAGVVVVARSQLGTINHTLMTLEILRRRDVDVRGVVLVGEEHPSSAAAIEKYGEIKIWGRIPLVPAFSHSWFLETFEHLEVSHVC